MIWITLLGCVTLHSTGSLADYSSEKERIRNAERSIRIATTDGWSDNTAERTLAIQNLGLLRSKEPDVIIGLQDLVTHPHPDIRRQSVWALGEIGRELAWNTQSQSVLHSLTNGLLSARSYLDAQYLLDAIIKIYTPHVHTTSEDLNLLRVLQQYLAKTEKPPTNFYLLEREIQSLPVLLELLGEHMTDSLDSLYTSNLALIRYLERNRSVLSTPQYREQIQMVLRKELELMTIKERSIQLLSLWTLATAAHHKLISEEVATILVEQVPLVDANVQPLLHMALWEMLEIQSVRTYFREFLTTSTDAEVQTVLGMLGRKVDLVQHLYNISVTGDTP